MRPQKILPLLILTMCSLGLRAQNNSGIPTELEYYQPYYAMSTNYFSVGLGLAIPVGQYGASPSADLPLLAPFVGQDGMGGSGGFSFALGYTGRLAFSQKALARNELEHKNVLYSIYKIDLGMSFLGAIDWTEVIPNSEGSGTRILSTSIGYGYAKNFNHEYVLEFMGSIIYSAVNPPAFYLDGPSTSNNGYGLIFIEPKSKETLGFGIDCYLRKGSWRLGLGFSRLFIYDFEYEIYIEGVNSFDITSTRFSSFTISTLQLNLSYTL